MDFNKNNIRAVILIAFSCILFYLGVKNIGLVLQTLGDVIDIIFPFILETTIAALVGPHPDVPIVCDVSPILEYI